MFEYNSDNEQSELLQNFWRSNKIKIISGILLLLTALYFGQNYFNNKNTDLKRAADLFYQLSKTEDEKYAIKITQKYPASTYAELVELWQAKRLVTDKKFEKALDKYNNIINRNKIASITKLATWYKINLLVEMKNYDLSLKELTKFTTDLDIKNELLGDIYLLSGKKSLAYNYYSAGMDASKDQIIIQRIRLKRQNIYQTP